MSAVAQWFWNLIALACLVWYSTITILVAVRGVTDIRGMLTRLRNGQLELEKDDTPDSP